MFKRLGFFIMILWILCTVPVLSFAESKTVMADDSSETESESEASQIEITDVEVNIKKAVLTWSKEDNADGYIIYYSSKKNSGYKKIKTITCNA